METAYYRNTPEFIQRLHDVRAWIADHPDSTREEIEAGTGHRGTINALLAKEAISQTRGSGRTTYRIKPMGCVGPRYLQWFESHLPHPDEILTDA